VSVASQRHWFACRAVHTARKTGTCSIWCWSQTVLTSSRFVHASFRQGPPLAGHTTFSTTATTSRPHTGMVTLFALGKIFIGSYTQPHLPLLMRWSSSLLQVDHKCFSYMHSTQSGTGVHTQSTGRVQSSSMIAGCPAALRLQNDSLFMAVACLDRYLLCQAHTSQSPAACWHPCSASGFPAKHEEVCDQDLLRGAKLFPFHAGTWRQPPGLMPRCYCSFWSSWRRVC